MLRVWLFFGVFVALSACRLSPSGDAAIKSLQIGASVVTVEVAASQAAQERGLQHRQTLGEDRGMLFVLGKPASVCMWMKDTPLALSVAFIDSRGVIVNVADMEPYNESEHCSSGLVAYALEVRRGWFADRHRGIGSVVTGL